VSFLELFYDLVYVAVIGQASHQLAEHISVRGAVEFAIIFGLIWFAWINGSLTHGAKPLPRSTSARDRSRESPGSGDACSPAWGQRWQLPNQPQPIGDPP